MVGLLVKTYDIADLTLICDFSALLRWLAEQVARGAEDENFSGRFLFPLLFSARVPKFSRRLRSGALRFDMAHWS